MTAVPPIERPDAPEFTVAILPDTQRHSEWNPAAFEIQTR